MFKKIDFYIIKNILFSFAASFFIISAVMMVGNVVKIYDILFTNGTTLKLIAHTFWYIFIFLSVFVLPMALTISINYVYSDMSNNFEVTALKNSGISLIRIYSPAFLFTVFIFIFLSYDLFSLAYNSRMSYMLELSKAFRNKIYVTLKPSTFYKVSGNVLWAKYISADHKRLKNVFFSTNKKVFTAKKALLNDIPAGILVNLYNVKMYSKKNNALMHGSFKKYSIAFYFKKIRKNRKYDVGYLTVSQIYNDYKKTHSKDDLYEINKRIALALGVFVLSLIGFSLGITFARSGKSFGIVINIFFFFIFYILLTFGQSVYEAYSIIWPVYLPDIALFLLGLYLFYRKVRI